MRSGRSRLGWTLLRSAPECTSPTDGGWMTPSPGAQPTLGVVLHLQVATAEQRGAWVASSQPGCVGSTALAAGPGMADRRTSS